MACRCSSAGSAGCACVVDVADTATVDLTATGTGDAATPRVISGDVKKSGAAGNVLVINPDGLYVPPPGPAVLPPPGCGLQLTAGAYSAKTHPFTDLTREQCNDRDDTETSVPLAAGCELEGTLVYCDSQGFLRTAPEKHTQVVQATSNEGFAPGISIVGLAPTQVGNTISVSVPNPSDCYCLCGYVTFAFIEAMSATPGSFSFIYHEVDYGDGLGFIPTTGFTWDKRNVPGMEARNDRIDASLPICLDPGETKMLQYRVMARRFAGDAGGTVTITALAKDIRFVGSNV